MLGADELFSHRATPLQVRRRVGRARQTALTTLHGAKRRSEPGTACHPPEPRDRRAIARSAVERSLYNRAVGYTFDSVKVFCSKDGVITKVLIKEHVPPDVPAQIFWLKNRKPAEWRDAWQMEHVLGRYIMSDKPMTEEELIKAHAIDVTPKEGEEK